MLPPTPVICGPTAGGKSSLAVQLAFAMRDRFGIPCEIITADAFQVYKDLNIGTAKPTLAEQQGIPHHLIDLVEPAGDASTKPFTLDDWLTLAHEKIDDLRSRNTLPIIVGGTHLYIKSLLEGTFKGPEPDPALRQLLTDMDPAIRRAELELVDPRAAERIHPNDIRRTVRALEIFRQTGIPISEHQSQWDRGVAGAAGFERPLEERFCLITLNWEVEALNRRINSRVKQMIEQGLLNEVRGLLDANRLGPQASEALGYKQLIPLVSAAMSRGVSAPPVGPTEDAIERIKIDTRRFAKNQRTWLRRLSITPPTAKALSLLLPDMPEDTLINRIVDVLMG